MTGVDQWAAQALRVRPGPAGPWADLTSWSYEELVAKGIDRTSAELDETEASLRDALRRTYGAVAFDIDGTLTAEATPTVEPALEATIRSLLQRGVHVILLTGRGKSTAEAVHQIASPRTFSKKYMRRLHCLYDNGASRFDVDVQDDGIELAVRPLARFPEEMQLGQVLRSLLASMDSKHPMTMRLRPERGRLQTVSKTERDVLYDILAASNLTFTSSSGSLESVRIARGVYGNLFTIDVTPTSKGEALRRLAVELGLHPARILRIGDQGHQSGNDFDILDSESGFSVGRTSSIPKHCHIVLAPSTGHKASPEGADPTVAWEQAFGARATDALLNMVRLHPPLTLVPDAGRNFVNKLLETEKVAWSLAADARKASFAAFSRRVARLFYDEAALFVEDSVVRDIYDPLSGAVRLRNWELEEVRAEAALWDLFQLERFNFRSEPAGALWAMYSDSGILLRGPGYYYAETEDGRRTKDAVSGYLERASAFLATATSGVAELINRPPTLVRVKMLLAVADNVRNFLLQLAHLAYIFETEAGAGPSSAFSNILERTLAGHIDLLWEMHRGTDTDWTALTELTFETLMAVGRDVSVASRSAIADGIRDAEPDLKILRRRECDSFLENLTAIELGLEKHAEHILAEVQQRTLVVGLSHGGIELPFIARAVGHATGRDITAGLLSVSSYGRSGEASIEGFGSYEPLDVLQNLWLESGVDFSKCRVLIADDNIMTGRSIEQARDALLDVGADVVGALVVRYPSVSRLTHMSYPDMARPDPDILLTYVRGLVSAGPYTRLVQPYNADESREGRLLDSTGRFDKQRDRIARYLVKNQRQPEG